MVFGANWHRDAKNDHDGSGNVDSVESTEAGLECADFVDAFVVVEVFTVVLSCVLPPIQDGQ